MVVLSEVFSAHCTEEGVSAHLEAGRGPGGEIISALVGLVAHLSW